MGGWMDGRESGVKDCFQQSKTAISLTHPGGWWVQASISDIQLFMVHLSNDYAVVKRLTQ